LKTKLTVTIDKRLLPNAKHYARSRGLSLSRFFENALREMGADEAGSFSRRWRGKFSLAGHDDERDRALTQKYV
jgi:hypothetical protein